MGPRLRLSLPTTFAVLTASAVVLGSAAFACTNLATLNLSSPTGLSGDTVTATGTSFRLGRDGAPTSPVVFHWNGTDGPVLAEVVPDGAGNVSASLAIPDAPPGNYVIVANQTKPATPEGQAGGHNPVGESEFGTPARAPFQVVGPDGVAPAEAAGTQAPAAADAGPSSTGLVTLTATLGAVGLALFAAGAVAVGRQVRRRDVPAAAPVRRD
ncbi:MAG: hypothetical protein ACRDZ9_09805 [Acidimicrobiales bacterium]